ncbi:MAG: GUN4 domain-containing protein [Crocosphaera sp.]
MNSIKKCKPYYAIEIMAPKYGSGYRIGGRLVLTSAHLFDNVQNDATCQVRSKSESKENCWETSAHIIWKAPNNIDIALIELPKEIGLCEPIGLGKLPDSNSAERVDFQGFCYPEWGRINHKDKSYAKRCQIEGEIYVADYDTLYNLVDLEVKRCPSILEVKQANLQRKSPWQGSSGAAIICHDLVVGVLKWHHNPDRPESLQAEPLTKVCKNEDWRELLKLHGIEPDLKSVSISSQAESLIISPEEILNIPDDCQFTTDCSKLESFLLRGNWRAADNQTADILLKIINKTGWLDVTIEDIENLSINELLRIDSLWKHHSHNHFGFGIQKQIYQDLGGSQSFRQTLWESFNNRVGWRRNGKFLNKNEINFSKKAPLGHLPVLVDSWRAKSNDVCVCRRIALLNRRYL